LSTVLGQEDTMGGGGVARSLAEGKVARGGNLDTTVFDGF
jgi:hypothetical protein